MEVLLKLLDRVFLKPYGVFVTMLIMVIFCIDAIPEAGESFIKLNAWIVISFITTIIHIIAIYSHNKLPVAKWDELGVLFVFHVQSDAVYSDAKHNLIENFNQTSNKIGKNMRAVCINSARLNNYNLGDEKVITTLLNKTNCVFCVDIVYHVDDINNSNKYIMKVQTKVVNPLFSESAGKLIKSELARISKSIENIRFVKEQKLEVFEITAEHLNLMMEYIVGLMLFFKQEYTDSYLIFNGLYSYLCDKESILLEGVKKGYYCTCHRIESLAFEEYYKTKDGKCLKIVEDNLSIMDSLYPNTYEYHLDMAALVFLRYRDITKSKAHVDMCKKINTDSIWRYSQAFLMAYTSNNADDVCKEYRYAIDSGYNIVFIIHFIENVIELEPERTMLYLALGILYNSINDKRNMTKNFNYFMCNYRFSAKEQNTKKMLESALVDKRCVVCDKDIACDECG